MRLEDRGGVTLLRMRAGKANAIGPDFLTTLDRLLDDVETQKPKALVIAGDDRAFSAGLELPALMGLDRGEMAAHMDQFCSVMRRVFVLDLPVVAAVGGHAIAGGCVLALQADVRLCADTPCKIGMNEAQLGIGLPAIVYETLRFAVPAKHLPTVAYEGQLVGPQTALELGLVDEVVPAEDLEDRALSRAERLSQTPPMAFVQLKRAMRAPTVAAADAAHLEQMQAWLDTWFSDEGQARLAAVVDRVRR